MIRGRVEVVGLALLWNAGCQPIAPAVDVRRAIASGRIGDDGVPSLEIVADDRLISRQMPARMPTRVDAALAGRWTDQRPVDVILRHDPPFSLGLLADHPSARLVERDDWIDRLRLTVDAATVRALAADPRVARIEAVPTFSADANAGGELRHATGVADLLADGLDGSVGSGRSASDRMLLAIVDVGELDADHPAWKDRRASVWAWDAELGRYAALDPGEELAEHALNHGSGVATQAISSGDPADPEPGGGMAPGAAWMFVHNEATDLALDLVAAAGADVVNLSQSCATCVPCSTGSWAEDALDRAMLSGVFVVSTPGNAGHATGRCTVHPPATASGSFTVNASVKSAPDLEEAPIADFSARGGDARGRPLIDLVAPSGREGPYQADFDDTWHEMGAGTSFAAPLVAGAAADLEQQLLGLWGDDARGVGLLWAELLLMGDDMTEDGLATPDRPGFDPVWGAGRLRVLRLAPGGLPSPWENQWWILDLGDGERTELPLSDGPLPAAASRLEVVAWWHEPNLAPGEEPAVIALSACDEHGECVDAGPPVPGEARVLADAVGGGTWTIVLDAPSVPASTDPWYHPGEEIREVFVAALWQP